MKPAAAKKVILLKPQIDTSDHAIASITRIETQSASSPTFKANPALQTALSVVSGQKTQLVANAKSQTELRAQLLAAVQAETGILGQLDTSMASLLMTLTPLVQSDPTIAEGMGVEPKGERTVVKQVVAPAGLRVSKLKSGADRIEIDTTPGARIYNFQISIDPPSVPPAPSSWIPIFGRGLKRAFPPLIPGQSYLIQAGAQASDGRPSEWSAPITYVAPGTKK